jgi:hypothetical protein
MRFLEAITVIFRGKTASAHVCFLSYVLLPAVFLRFEHSCFLVHQGR